ncbi:MAG TPA: PA2169 family four-helix-bundle protein [Blastocatellia bacterium]|nr:PA2169 family four-helix-bundle protein [Blastocatellia bacterium]
MDSKKAISTLNDLIETCRDGQNGFKEAAENVKSPDLKTFLNQIAAERAQFVNQLQLEVRTLGGDPQKSGSATAAMHRAWIDIKGTLTGKDDHSILSECERGEDSAVEAYKDALKLDPPPNIRSTIERQFQSIKLVHDRVKQMRDSKAAAQRR